MFFQKINPLVLVILLVSINRSIAATCEFIQPSTGSCTPEGNFGLVIIPGAQIAGEAYKPLAQKIQGMFPGDMWLGLTDFFLADFPNPIEISSAINSCLEQAA